MATYLDFNASSPIHPLVLDRMIDVYRNHYGNADSRTHIFGTEAKEIVASSRATIASILKIDSTDLLFTSGSTESNNMAILGLRDYAEKTGRKHFITTAIEHKSVLMAMKRLEEHGFHIDYISPDQSGRIKAKQVLDLVTEETLLVSIMHVNSETGIIQPIQKIGEALSDTKTYLHVDATQGFGKLNDDLRATKYDMLSMTAHKLGGPQGVGGFVFKRDRNYKRPPITPLMCGGQQERGYRPGTTPVALVAGFAKAAELCEENMKEHAEKNRAIKENLIRALEGINYQFNGDQQYCIPSTANISFQNVDAEALFLAMKSDYAFSNGSACNSGSHEPSYVLRAMGLEDKRIYEAVRISWDPETKVDFTELAAYVKSMQ